MSTTFRVSGLSLLLTFLVVGEASALAAIPGQIGPYRIQVFTEPAVIPVGKARLRIDVTDAAGTPVEGAEIRSLVKMPAMSMGETENLAQPLPGQPGSYTADASFAMAGRFEASFSIRGRLGEANGTLALDTGQSTGIPDRSSGPSLPSFSSLQPWLLVALLVLVLGFVLFRMRRTGQTIPWKSLLNRGTVGGVLLIVSAWGVSQWAINRWRRPGAMTPIEAQSMEMNAPAPPGVALVTLAEVSRGPIENAVSYPGQAIAFNEQDVIVRTEGWIQWIPFYVGQQVQPEEVVAHLDISELQAFADVDRMRAELRGRNDALEAADAEVAAAREEREGANADLVSKQSMITEAEAMIAAMDADRQFWQQQNTRNKTLLDKGALSLEEYQRDASMAANALAKLQQAQARLEQARAEVRSAQAMARRSEAMIAAAEKRKQQMASDVLAAEASVRSSEARAGGEPAGRNPPTNTPHGHVEVRTHIGGVVTQRPIGLGQHVSPGQSILKIAQLDPIRLQANVAEADLARITNGNQVAVRARDASEPPLVAKVTSITPTVDPVTRTGVVEAVVPNHGRRFIPGQFITLDIFIGRSQDTLRVPVAAVHVRAETGTGPLAVGTANYVWIAEASGANNRYTVRPVDVVTGISDGINVQIVSGLEAGQKIVVLGSDYLKRGDAVSAVVGPETPR